jgi:hypothetical protein
MAASASFAQAGGFHADEPLRRGAEDRRRLVAPAVGDAVVVLESRQQMRPRCASMLDDLRIGLGDLHPAEQRQVRGEAAIALHRVDHFAPCRASAH